MTIFSRPGQSQGLLYKHLRNSLTDSFIDHLLKIFLQCRHTENIKNGASSHKTNYSDRECKSWRESKLLYWFKSYGDFAECVDFAYWWSCIGKGLRLQPLQQAFLN